MLKKFIVLVLSYNIAIGQEQFSFPGSDEWTELKETKEEPKPVEIIEPEVPNPKDPPLSNIIGDKVELEAPDKKTIGKLKTRPVYDYRKQIVPPIFRKGNKDNKHIPTVFMQSEYSLLLFNAIEQGHIGAINALLERGADINTRLGKTKITPLMKAAQLNKADIVKYLVIRGADFNLKDSEGNSVLHFVARNNNLLLLEWLTQNGANFLSINAQRKMPYDYVSQEYKINKILQELKTQEEINKAFLKFISEGQYKVVSALLNKGADVNFHNKRGVSGLIIAAQINNSDIVKLLISKGANLFATDGAKFTALDYAFMNNNIELAEILDTQMTKYELDHDKKMFKGRYEEFALNSSSKVKVPNEPTSLQKS